MLDSLDIPPRDRLTRVNDKPTRFEPVGLDIDPGLWWWQSREECRAACDAGESSHGNSTE